MTEDVKSEGHTPTPWRRDNRRFADYGMVHISGGHYIVAHALGQMSGCETEAEANAHLIVTAVNEREALLRCEAALRRALPFIDDAEDAHSVMSESSVTDECRSVVTDARAALTLLDEARK